MRHELDRRSGAGHPLCDPRGPSDLAGICAALLCDRRQIHRGHTRGGGTNVTELVAWGVKGTAIEAEVTDSQACRGHAGGDRRP